jgi:hypothetical protein
MYNSKDANILQMFNQGSTFGIIDYMANENQMATIDALSLMDNSNVIAL